MKKLIERLNQFKHHEVTRNSITKALLKYVYFHLAIRLTSRLKFKWIGNLHFYAYRRDAGIIGNLFFGLQEFAESIFTIHFLRKTDLFLDIGANVGHYCLLASGIKKCNSIAVEPVPNTFSRLNDNISLNNLKNKIQTKNIGVGDTNCELLFSNDKNNMNRIVDDNYPNSVKVSVNKIDDFVSINDVSIMKIDVEGFEKFVLQGCLKTLKNKNLKAIIIELNNSGLKYNVDDDELYKFILKFGFKPYSYNPLKRELKLLESYNKSQFNTIFIRDLNFVNKRVQSSESIKVWSKTF